MIFGVWGCKEFGDGQQLLRSIDEDDLEEGFVGDADRHPKIKGEKSLEEDGAVYDPSVCRVCGHMEGDCGGSNRA